MPAKLDRCVEQLQEQGYSESQAFAICTDRLYGDDDKEAKGTLGLMLNIESKSGPIVKSYNRKQCNVYWVHLPGANIKTDGYVGITSRGFVKRRKEHLSLKSKSHHLTNAIEKYSDELIWDVVFIGSVEGCLQLEEYWRPHPKIGWNIRSGGILYTMAEETKDKLRMQAIGRTASDETRAKLSKAGKGRKHTEQHKANISTAHKGKTMHPDTKLKLLAVNIGRSLSATTKEKIKAATSGVKNHNARAIICVETATIYNTLIEAANAIGVKVSSICGALKGRTKTSGGFTWQYC